MPPESSSDQAVAVFDRLVREGPSEEVTSEQRVKGVLDGDLTGGSGQRVRRSVGLACKDMRSSGTDSPSPLVAYKSSPSAWGPTC